MRSAETLVGGLQWRHDVRWMISSRLRGRRRNGKFTEERRHRRQRISQRRSDISFPCRGKAASPAVCTPFATSWYS